MLVVTANVAGGCSDYNRHLTRSEDDSLSNVTQISRGFLRAGQASLSKDQRWVAFQAIPVGGGDYQIYLAKVTSNQGEITGIERPVRVTPAGSRNTSPSISPDGLSLIFSSTAGTRDTSSSAPKRIFRVDGWEDAVSMASAASGIDLAQHALPMERTGTDCSFSPDGKHICFSSRDGSNNSIFAMHADGTHVVRITAAVGNDGGPFFSPDGHSIVFRGDRDGRNLPQVYLKDLTFDAAGEITGGSTERSLTHDDFVNYGPRWHPDGNHIIYSTSKFGKTNYELFVMDRTGKRKTQVTFFEGSDLFPSFSPDGKYLLWTSKRAADASMQVFSARFGFPRGS